MVDPTLTISIDRSSLSLSPLVFSGANDSVTWGVLEFTAPNRQARIQYAADSPFVHGSTAVSATWSQALMSFDLFPAAASEAALRTLEAELYAAVGQFAFLTTVTINGQDDVWTCDMGSVVQAAREFEDLRDFNPTYTVTIPCYPVAS